MKSLCATLRNQDIILEVTADHCSLLIIFSNLVRGTKHTILKFSYVFSHLLASPPSLHTTTPQKDSRKSSPGPFTEKLGSGEKHSPVLSRLFILNILSFPNAGYYLAAYTNDIDPNPPGKYFQH